MKGKLSSKLSPQGIHVGPDPRDTNAGETMLLLVLLCTGNMFGLHCRGQTRSVAMQAASRWHILCELPTRNTAIRS